MQFHAFFYSPPQVFFTKYKGVVLRNGSPLRGNFDRVLVRLLETGITDKVTQDEYNGVSRRRGRHGRRFERDRAEQMRAARRLSEDEAAKSRKGVINLRQMSSPLMYYGFVVALAVLSFVAEVD